MPEAKFFLELAPEWNNSHTSVLRVKAVKVTQGRPDKLSSAESVVYEMGINVAEEAFIHRIPQIMVDVPAAAHVPPQAQGTVYLCPDCALFVKDPKGRAKHLADVHNIP